MNLRRRSVRTRLVRGTVWVFAILCSACGKKGPPLPPLVKLPVAPLELTAERRGARVDLQFVVPSANTDNTRPANVSRVDVYAVTGPPAPTALTDAQLLKYGTKIASLNVKAPRDPDQTIEEDEPEADMEPAEGKGLDQGGRAQVSEELNEKALLAIDLSKETKARSQDAAKPAAGPLLPPPAAVLSRIYVGVGVSQRGRRGPFSKRASVPLIEPPPAPASPSVTYDERQVTIKWDPISIEGGIQGPPSDDELASTPVNVSRPTIAYNVYDATASTKLTRTSATATEFSDPRIVWGERRCYTIRAAESVGGLTLESEAPAPACVTLTDTFAPAAPSNLQSSPGEGSISLIWDPNSEKDVAGYLVFRGVVPSEDLQQITPTPIAETTFRDVVQPGTVYVYAVKAVDRAGNVSAMSSRIRETAR